MTDLDAVVDRVIERLGKTIVAAIPLGAGKPNHLINALYGRAKRDSSIKLSILTALTLQKPWGKSELEKRFLGPVASRVFGDYPDLFYELDRMRETVPRNIQIIEFYFPAGKYVGNSLGQRNYLSSNFTHVARDVCSRGANLICQQVAKGEIDGREVFSLSCNSDTTLDLADLIRKEPGRDLMIVGQTNQNLPFMYGESIVASEFFDIMVDDRAMDYKIFGPPKLSVSDADYLIGLHASALIKDDGEIQIGIGSLGDALVYALCLRNKENKKFREILEALEINATSFPVLGTEGSLEPFNKGLFAATEMFVDSFMYLFQEKILKKKVYDSVVLQRLINLGLIEEDFRPEILDLLIEHRAISARLTESDHNFLREFGILRSTTKWINDALVLESGERLNPDLRSKDAMAEMKAKSLGKRLRNGAVAHAGFFLGPAKFYDFLRGLPVSERKLIRMKRISQINQLYGHEEIDRLQRRNGRFINTCMKMALNGAASSDALENGAQVSGVGGQYNFVAMAHELPGARSILQLRSTRLDSKGKPESNIVFSYGSCTIPKHLRDIVITEYGIADLRGKTDEEVAIELIKIADSRFQEKLLMQAKAAKKVGKDYECANSIQVSE